MDIVPNIVDLLKTQSNSSSHDSFLRFRQRFARLSLEFTTKFEEIKSEVDARIIRPVSLNAILRLSYRLSLTNYASEEWNESQPMVGFYPPSPLQVDIISSLAATSITPSVRIGVAKSVMMNIEARIKKSVMERKTGDSDAILDTKRKIADIPVEPKLEKDEGKRKRPRVINFGFDDD